VCRIKHFATRGSGRFSSNICFTTRFILGFRVRIGHPRVVGDVYVVVFDIPPIVDAKPCSLYVAHTI